MSIVYVMATDSFMSGWGRADGKRNRLIIETESEQEALSVVAKLKKRDEMKSVTMSHNKPNYSTKRYYISYYDINDMTWRK